ncbi:MAG: hypothetical protein RBU21_13965 [FCB group bacterium]|jgi:hypothetical protein|nr:hypothetical protein [FCB group bacterium]
MIPYHLMLVAWIPISALLMMDKKPVRGFAIAMLAGMLLLPSGKSLILVGLPDLDKGNVAPLGVLLGTLAFHPNYVMRFRPRLADLIFLIVMAFMVMTSMKNGHGVYDGLSTARGFLFNFVLPVMLARIYCSTLNDLAYFLVIFSVAAAGYAFPALWEWRMSPQLHRTFYGYFPHTWLQFRRGAFFRPLVFFGHALPLGRFFAFAAFLTMLPLRAILAKHLPYGKWLFVAPLIGLIVSMSYGPYGLFAMLCGLYYVARKRLWLVYVIPVAAAIWMVLVLMGTQPMFGVVDQVHKLNPQRALSLEYRLEALDTYSVTIRQEPIFGYGGWNSARNELATDSAFLIWALTKGLVSASLLFGWWFLAMHSCVNVARRYGGTPLADLMLGIALLLGLSIAYSMIDDALDYHSMLLASAALGLEAVLRRGVPVPGGAAVARQGYAMSK